MPKTDLIPIFVVSTWVLNCPCLVSEETSIKLVYQFILDSFIFVVCLSCAMVNKLAMFIFLFIADHSA